MYWGLTYSHVFICIIYLHLTSFIAAWFSLSERPSKKARSSFSVGSIIWKPEMRMFRNVTCGELGNVMKWIVIGLCSLVCQKAPVGLQHWQHFVSVHKKLWRLKFAFHRFIFEILVPGVFLYWCHLMLFVFHLFVMICVEFLANVGQSFVMVSNKFTSKVNVFGCA